MSDFQGTNSLRKKVKRTALVGSPSRSKKTPLAVGNSVYYADVVAAGKTDFTHPQHTTPLQPRYR